MYEKTAKGMKTTSLDRISWVKNYFFTPRSCLACARWAPGCREFDRSAPIYELRIEEACDYLDLFDSVFKKLTQIKRALTRGNETRPSAKAVGEILSLIDVAQRSNYRLNVLNDDEMTDLNEKLGIVLRGPENSLVELICMFGNETTPEKTVSAEELSEAHKKAADLVFKMRRRLDKMKQISLLKCPIEEARP